MSPYLLNLSILLTLQQSQILLTIIIIMCAIILVSVMRGVYFSQQ